MNRFPKLLQQVVGKALGSKMWAEGAGVKCGTRQAHRAPSKVKCKPRVTG